MLNTKPVSVRNVNAQLLRVPYQFDTKMTVILSAQYHGTFSWQLTILNSAIVGWPNMSWLVIKYVMTQRTSTSVGSVSCVIINSATVLWKGHGDDPGHLFPFNYVATSTIVLMCHSYDTLMTLALHRKFHALNSICQGHVLKSLGATEFFKQDYQVEIEVIYNRLHNLFW